MKNPNGVTVSPHRHELKKKRQKKPTKTVKIMYNIVKNRRDSFHEPNQY